MNTQTLTRQDADTLRHNVDRRLLILELLYRANDHRINEIILRIMLCDLDGEVDRHTVQTDLFWLQQQGLALVINYHDLLVAELTSFGRQLMESQLTTPSPAAQAESAAITTVEKIELHNVMNGVV